MAIMHYGLVMKAGWQSVLWCEFSKQWSNYQNATMHQMVGLSITHLLHFCICSIGLKIIAACLVTQRNMFTNISHSYAYTTVPKARDVDTVKWCLTHSSILNSFNFGMSACYVCNINDHQAEGTKSALGFPKMNSQNHQSNKWC